MHSHSQKRRHLQTFCKLSILPACCKLSISSSYNKSVKIRLFATCHLLICYNLIVETTCHKTVEIINLQQVCWQFATSLLTTYNRFVVTSCRKPCELILISTCCNKLLQDVNRLVATCAFLVVWVKMMFAHGVSLSSYLHRESWIEPTTFEPSRMICQLSSRSGRFKHVIFRRNKTQFQIII